MLITPPTIGWNSHPNGRICSAWHALHNLSTIMCAWCFRDICQQLFHWIISKYLFLLRQTSFEGLMDHLSKKWKSNDKTDGNESGLYRDLERGELLVLLGGNKSELLFCPCIWCISYEGNYMKRNSLSPLLTQVWGITIPPGTKKRKVANERDRIILFKKLKASRGCIHLITNQTNWKETFSVFFGPQASLFWQFHPKHRQLLRYWFTLILVTTWSEMSLMY